MTWLEAPWDAFCPDVLAQVAFPSFVTTATSLSGSQKTLWLSGDVLYRVLQALVGWQEGAAVPARV